MLKSVALNARGESAKHLLEATRLGQPKYNELRNEILFEELKKYPGSTWGAYTARRLLMRRCEQKLPPVTRLPWCLSSCFPGCCFSLVL
jgi:hypothetical protein